ncbi:TPA: family 2A encapsulin nanocompartment cargo protein cysteine desulfurase [Acinetobacter baumannii]|uniref:family 2A encapsulin nanocompartment cargo protein cysteine desulfurase n=1 Tax=Acinetobacter baumannii TaxID=470 RepID=UPI0001AF27FF|nr:family 2A encapsulin nanocompartment cargo protein cysteine desulfurase [Acinetobacter baumannii]EHU1904283.1 cysteine desulfurase [Acinetobacter baumannii]EHU1920963.1 cysteine desulfurase [Acinetobacter baumannii]EHU1965539.1 cysteine desulfurase [Acinetobacter baumannii]EKP43849.1 cysteine desulfurase, SufS family [Acinetobacter baumannii OIFC111]EKU3891371.1 cysteine desulfurase [Acinetobacter baumannii]
MTTQLTTSNLQGSSTGPEVTGANPPANFPDESTIARLANEFFSALPSSSSSASPSGLNLDLPVGAPPHPPQPGEPFSALSGRAPNIAFQKSLNPEYPEHIPNLPDYPERRIVASAPVVGGANLPHPPFEPHLPQAAHNEPNVPRIEPGLPTGAGESPYYFLNDFSAPNTLEPSVKGVEDNYSVAQSFQLPHGDQLKSLLTEDRFATNTPPQSSASSAFYFLDLPQSGQSYSHYQPSQPTFVASSAQPFDVHAIRRDFPILQERVNGRPLVWFDNAATTQKPQHVINRIAYFYQHENSNIHRAAHELAARATDAYEHARNVVARFIGAPSSKEIIFVRGTTEGINLIAKTWGEQNIGEGDEIIVSHLEHHANIVPWYQLTKKTGAKLRVIPVDDTGQIILEELPKLINERTKLLSITQVSNALGTVTPVAEVIKIAHAKGVRVLVDGAQSVSHIPTDVQALDADFFVFSGHKVFGPTGIGAVYAKPELLESMPVWEGGGNMIQDVTFEQVVYQPAPNKFEAGTGNIADAVGLGAALEYVESLGIHNIARYEHDLLEYGQNALSSVSGLRLIGTAHHKASVMSFTLQGYSTEQVGKALNQHGIAVRSGHHCAQPILRRFGVEQTVRPSLAFYNTTEEIDLLVSVLHQLTRNRRSN